MNITQRDNLLTWAEALESGKYKQCTGNLVINENGNSRYCCLGVANKIFSNIYPDYDLGKFIRNCDVKNEFGLYPGINESYFFFDMESDAVVRMLSRFGNYTQVKLSNMNDLHEDGKHVFDFNEIAQFIRAIVQVTPIES